MLKTVAITAATLYGLSRVHYVARWLYAGDIMSTPLWAPLMKEKKVDWSASLLQRPHITLLQSYTSNIKDYAELAESINKQYAKVNGYDFVVKKLELGHGRNHTWDKVYYLKELLEQGKPRIFWIDSDAVIDDHSKRLDSIEIAAGYGADISICTSFPFTKNINTGTMYVKNTDWSRKFVDAWWNWHNTKWHTVLCHEQSALDEMLANDIMGCRSNEKIALFAHSEFNSDYEHIIKLTGSFVQHYRGCNTRTRAEAFQKIASKLAIKNNL
jgi:hypothetical protein